MRILQNNRKPRAGKDELFDVQAAHLRGRHRDRVQSEKHGHVAIVVLYFVCVCVCVCMCGYVLCL